MSSDKLINLTKNNFDLEVLNSDRPVLVDFWAQWCGPCRAVGPIIEELASDFDGKIKVGKINVDDEGELAAKFRVMSIPTILLFKGGQIVDKIVGMRQKSDFTQMVNKYL